MRRVLFLVSVTATMLSACADSSAGTGGTGGAGNTRGSFPCSEQGVRDAIAADGMDAPQLDCFEETLVQTSSTVVVDRDVVLDGRGYLTLDGANDHLVLRVASGVNAELLGIAITNGSNDDDAGGIINEGALRLVDSVVTDNDGKVGGITNYGTLELERTEIMENEGTEVGALANEDEAYTQLIASIVFRNNGDEVPGIMNRPSGEVRLVQSVIADACGGVVSSDGGNIMTVDMGCGFDAESDRTTLISDWHD